MNPKNVIHQILKQYLSQLISEIDKANTLLGLHRIYDSGKTLEIALKNFLASLLPEFVGITRGHVFSEQLDSASKEIDLILFDKRYFSGFHVEKNEYETISYVPINVVFGIISVKKKLTLKSIRDSVNNINSVYNLDRKPLHNHFHYDLNLGNALEFRNGIELNRIFSCVIAYSSEFFYRLKNGIKIERTKDELTKYLNEFQNKKWFNNFRVDIVFTLDGMLFSPLEYKEALESWVRSTKIELLGKEKKALLIIDNVDSNRSDLILGYSIDKKFPEKLLGQFLIYLQLFCSQLVKNPPNIEEIFKQVFATTLDAITRNK